MLGAITDRLVADLEPLEFRAPVTHVYNPLRYARAAFDAYVERYARVDVEAILLGMNPGPWGMAQTGIPFGDPTAVREWLGIRASIGKPACEHPKRPVRGIESPRTEVSGARLWGWARDVFETPQRFFARFFVANYCPLAFLEASGRNLTPDHLEQDERRRLQAICDRALLETVTRLRPKIVVGVGAFAEARARQALAAHGVAVGRIPHPSPASPVANRGWAELATAGLRELGLRL
ncbi:MAG: single-stranded DNA-binding protein [Deltaproteobacteria bacterium]|nr:single-stranded DNA-binding protein [Deltaproteobacteria bacterium]